MYNLHLRGNAIRGLARLLLCGIRRLGYPWERKATGQCQEAQGGGGRERWKTGPKSRLALTPVGSSHA